MIYSYDPAKSDKNALERGISVRWLEILILKLLSFGKTIEKTIPNRVT